MQCLQRRSMGDVLGSRQLWISYSNSGRARSRALTSLTQHNAWAECAVQTCKCLLGGCAAAVRAPACACRRLLGRPQRRVDDALHRRKVQKGRQRDKGVEQLVVAKHLRRQEA